MSSVAHRRNTTYRTAPARTLSAKISFTVVQSGRAILLVFDQPLTQLSCCMVTQVEVEFVCNAVLGTPYCTGKLPAA